MTTTSHRTVGILVFEDVEVLDFCGPFEVFASAALPPEAPGAEELHLFQPIVLAERMETIRCRGGLLVVPHRTLADHPPLDIVVVPGGYGTRRERSNPVVLDWVARQRDAGALVTSVCTGAFVLAATGMLDGHPATTHWSTIDWLRETHPAIDVRDDRRIIDLGPVITSAGVSAGIDMALHVVGRLHGEEIARRTARDMEYDWTGAGAAGA